MLRASVRAGAETQQARVWTDDERQARREAARRLGLARHIRPGYHGSWWTAEGTGLAGDDAGRRGCGPDRLHRERRARQAAAGGVCKRASASWARLRPPASGRPRKDAEAAPIKPAKKKAKGKSRKK
jgi:hypothetical protein